MLRSGVSGIGRVEDVEGLTVPVLAGVGVVIVVVVAGDAGIAVVELCHIGKFVVIFGQLVIGVGQGIVLGLQVGDVLVLLLQEGVFLHEVVVVVIQGVIVFVGLVEGVLQVAQLGLGLTLLQRMVGALALELGVHAVPQQEAADGRAHDHDAQRDE